MTRKRKAMENLAVSSKYRRINEDTRRFFYNQREISETSSEGIYYVYNNFKSVD